MNLLQEIKNRFKPSLAKYADAETLPGILAMIRVAQDAKFGDYQANCAMSLGKNAGKPPRQVAEDLLTRTDLDDLAEKTDVAGPGFINITLKNELLNQQLLLAYSDLDRLGIAPVRTPKKFVVDFSSPNVAKPMHVGHIRSTVIGDSLSRVLRFLGHDVVTDNHLGDWGTQFGMIIYGYKHFLNEEEYRLQPVGELSRIYRTVRTLIDYHTANDKLPDAMDLLAKQKQHVVEFEQTDAGDDKALQKRLKKDIKHLRSKIATQTETVSTYQETVQRVVADADLFPLTDTAPHKLRRLFCPRRPDFTKAMKPIETSGPSS